MESFNRFQCLRTHIRQEVLWNAWTVYELFGVSVKCSHWSLEDKQTIVVTHQCKGRCITVDQNSYWHTTIENHLGSCTAPRPFTIDADNRIFQSTPSFFNKWPVRAAELLIPFLQVANIAFAERLDQPLQTSKKTNGNFWTSRERFYR